MEKVEKITQGEKAFIACLIAFVVDTNPENMLTNLTKVSKYMLDELDSKCEANLHRKQYGNLKDAVLQGVGVTSVFSLDGTAFRFRSNEDVVAAFEKGYVTEEAMEKYKEGYEKYVAHQEKFGQKKF